MNKLLKTCKVYSGIRDQITEAEEALIIDLINTEFKTIKDSDLAQAFKLNATGKYWKTVEGYQHFSAIFVGKVLSSYKEWKRKEAAKPKLIEPKKQIEMPKEDFKKHLKYVKKEYQKNGKLPTMNSNGLYWYMIDQGLINPSKEYIKEVSSEIKKEHKNKINQAKKDFKINLVRALEQSVNKSTHGAMVRKRIIKKYLDSI